MAIEDVIRDLGTYFGSLGQHPTMKAQMGGIVNPSYFLVEYKGQTQVFEFWSVQGGSEAEKKLAKAFLDDITEFIRRTDHAIEQERLESLSTAEHQDRDLGGEATEAGSGDSPVSPAPSKRRGRPRKEKVTNLQQTDVA